MGIAEPVEKIPACSARYQASKSAVLRDLDKLESIYVEFRGLKSKIRIVEYERLWAARRGAMDPLSALNRSMNQREEARLLDLLKLYDKRAERKADAFVRRLELMQAVHTRFRGCCEDSEVQVCIESAFASVNIRIDAVIKHFDHVLEREREYDAAVKLTFGGRSGLYPDDTVETQGVHSDFFSRFERERREDRFHDDKIMTLFFEDLKRLVTDSFPADNCCLKCGKTEWDSKSDKIIYGIVT